MERVTKTLITRTEDLKPGDVIYIDETRQRYLNNQKQQHKLPECNFHRLTVVTRVEPHESDGICRFDHQHYDRLTSTNGDHLIVLDLLKSNTILTNGTFGCNSQVDEHRKIWRLDTITNHRAVFHPMPNLKGNPAYDLMM